MTDSSLASLVEGPLNGPPDPNSPTGWRDRLLGQLANRQRHIRLNEQYYHGEHPLPDPPKGMSNEGFSQAKRAFLSLSKMGVTNYVKLVADAPAERLRVIGFRTGGEPEGDKAVWALWQANGLDADSAILHRSAIVCGTAFELVWPGGDGEPPLITVEHGAQAIVGYQPGSRRARAAGLKTWEEEDGTFRVVLYLPDAVYKWSKGKGSAPLVQWQPSTDDSWPIANPFNPQIPLVEFRANPSLRPALYGGGHSDFHGVLPIQDRINKTVFDRLVTAEFQAFRQRWATGWTPDNPNEAVQASMRHLLTFEDTDVKVGEFAQADFTGFLKAVEADVQAMAAITRTPSFYTLGQITNISADALMALQSGLVARTVGHRDNFGESHEEVLRLARKAAGDPGWADPSSQMMWASVEHVTWAEIADATMKLSTIGVPREALWSMLPDVTPSDIERWKVMVAAEDLLGPVQPPGQQVPRPGLPIQPPTQQSPMNGLPVSGAGG